MNYKYITVDYNSEGTYPYISGEQAWQQLQNGGGYIPIEPEIGTEAVIRRVGIAYYDSLNSGQTYLQPIYVFRGDNDFVAYVPALAPISYNQAAINQRLAEYAQ